MSTVAENVLSRGSSLAKKLVIPMENLASPRKDVYIGERVRQSTTTSVIFLDANTIACCHFNGCRMFLIRFDLGRGTFKVIDSIDTVFGGEKVETDLMGGDGTGNLVTTNFFQNTCSLYRREGDSVRFVRDLGYNTGNRVHGVKFFRPGTIAVTSRQDAGGVHFFDVETLKRTFLIGAPGLAVQDVCFPGPARAATISSQGSPRLTPFKIYSSLIHIIDFNLQTGTCVVARKRLFERSHFDNCALHEGLVYLSDQYNNVILVVDPETLETVRVLDGYDFAHGVDVNFGMIAVTNYGNNTIDIRSL